jgi:iron complex outermembrane receptor protein
MGRFRNGVLSPVLAACLSVLIAGPAFAQDKSVSVDIPPQSLATALDQLARQGDIQTLYTEDAVRDKQSPGVQGTLSTREAVEKLLEGTGLTYTFTAEDTVTVKAVDTSSEPPVTVSAPVEPRPPVQLSPVVVIATRDEVAALDAPAAVSVVTSEDIEKRNVKTVDDALNTVPGVFNRRTKGLMDTNPRVNLRGFAEQKRTLVLLDGLPLNDPSSGLVNFSGIELGSIDQIEVAGGPFSSLYGGSAMGGVVSIVTKAPRKQEAHVTVGYGSSWERGQAMDDTRHVAVSLGQRYADRWGLRLGYELKATNGYPTTAVTRTTALPAGFTGAEVTTNNTGAVRYLIGDTGDNTYREHVGSLKTRYDLSATSYLDLLVTLTQNRYGYDSPHTLVRDSNGIPVFAFTGTAEGAFLSTPGGSTQATYGLVYSTMVSAGHLKMTVGKYDQFESYFVTPTAATATRFGGTGIVSSTPSWAYNADLQYSVPIFADQELTVGGSAIQGWAGNEQNTVSDWRAPDSKTGFVQEALGKSRATAIFLQDQIRVADPVTVYLGVRQDWWRTYDGSAMKVGTGAFSDVYESRNDSALSPKAAVVYRPGPVTAVRASIGKAFRPPTLFELYQTFVSTAGTLFLSNPDLEPETTTSWEVGFQHTLGRTLTVQSTYFDNEIRDLIYRGAVTGQPTFRQSVNAGRAKSIGVELGLSQRLDLGLRWFANYTYTDAVIKANAAVPASVGKKVTNIPQNMVNLGVDWEHGPVLVSFTGRHVSKIFSTDANTDIVEGVPGSYDPYTVADAKFAYKLTDALTASVAIDNIFDKEYSQFYWMPGRSWMAELTMDVF